MHPKKFFNIETLIIGAGASGLFSAWLLSAAKQRYLIIDSGSSAGRKLGISGGGHANFTNLNMSPAHFISSGKGNFCKHALQMFPPEKFMGIIQSMNLQYEQKNSGKIFLIQQAKELVKSLHEPIGGNLHKNTRALNIKIRDSDFMAVCENASYLCKNIIISPGSPASPKLAQCPYCWNILANLGLFVISPRAALSPLLFPQNLYEEFLNLSGLSLTVKISIIRSSEKTPYFIDKMLFTHFGLSGPAILNISLYFLPGDILEIDFLPEHSFETLLNQNENKKPWHILRKYLPQNLVELLIPESFKNKNCAELSRNARKWLGQQINHFQFHNLKTAGLARAEVCAGGVATSQINPKTMEATAIPGLYVTGEAVDVTGELGGYNLHWAFASAFCAANNIININKI